MMTDAIGIATFGTKPFSASGASEQDVTQLRIFSRAVVLQTLCDPSSRDEKADADLIRVLKNSTDYMRAPRNSVICRIIDEGQGRTEGADFVCFPFFSSHISLPVKAGEQVWLFFEQPGLQNTRPYWLSRIPEPIFVEDANFTHSDRKGTSEQNGGNADDRSGNFSSPRNLTFPNGASSTAGLATIPGDDTAFNKVITEAKEAKSVVLEPVPRVTKRPGDLVLQGSNNTLIRLGTTMGWGAANRPSTNTDSSIATKPTNENILAEKMGAIDIVVGRGRYFQGSDAEKNVSKENAPDKSTRPLIEKNVLGKYETDKNVSTQQKNGKGNTKTNPQEGDPDFLLDASRVFVSEKADIDEMLGTGPLGISKHFEKPIEAKKGPVIAVKSEHIRIVARKSKLKRNKDKEPDDIVNESPAANGSIRIIKEGEDGEDMASIALESDGVVQISGSKIFIGRSKDGGGEGNGPGPGGSQPYVKYSELEALLEKLFDDMSKFVEDLQKSFLSNTTPGFGGPNPALIKSANNECLVFSAAISSRRNEIKKLMSTRIFGE